MGFLPTIGPCQPVIPKGRRTGSYAFFDVNKLLVVLGIQNDRYELSNNFFLLLLQSKSQLVYGFFVGASWACLAVGMVAGVASWPRVQSREGEREIEIERERL